MASNKIKQDTMELHDYPRKPEIEYKDSFTGTYHYTIISEEYYSSPPILVKTQKKNNSYRIPNNYKVISCFTIKYNNNSLQIIESWQSATHMIYKPNRTSMLPGTVVFGLQLKCIEQARYFCHQFNIL
ncbi:1571_t:CDS:2 [Cetraspora pellucida]|uniref:1571_t:CDS:1 n=1 Tax=Cetraspora pellucida TaxID=1433469 RepID=A0A9N9FHJ8_9GLOM|nr:1571_t:CDS:2 [Cetraspora pellucida]